MRRFLSIILIVMILTSQGLVAVHVIDQRAQVGLRQLRRPLGKRQEVVMQILPQMATFLLT